MVSDIAMPDDGIELIRSVNLEKPFDPVALCRVVLRHTKAHMPSSISAQADGRHSSW